MSWKASAWAKEQRLGSPAAKSILLCLADYADAERAECFPSQAQLAADAEVSERTAREWLQRLEDWGLIDRQRRSRASGARASDLIVLRLDARVTDGAERCRDLKETAETGDAGEDLPAEIAGRSYRQPATEPTGNERQPTGNGCRAYKEEPPIEPPNGTSQPGAQARERGANEDDGKDGKAAERQFWRIVKTWPGFDGMPKEPAMKPFLALSPDKRDMAERRLAGWLALLKAQGKSHVPAPSTYFREELFAAVADPADPASLPSYEPPFGKGWCAMRFRALLLDAPGPLPKAPAALAAMMARDDAQGRRMMLDRQAAHGWPVVNAMHQRAQMEARGVAVPAEMRAVGERTEAVKVHSDLWEAWRAEHARRGWPQLPDTGKQEYVYLPAGGPAGLDAFAAALRAAQGGQEAAE